ncbi:MAG: ATP-binding protein [Proteobacteria bacterium]|nr:ATP-binding protein [Pseudomonadota bacterium]MDA0929498.1 ATP-binding protein [Pseudomonadota bacterium]
MDIQELFSSIIESMPSALITVDGDLRIKHINTNALRISNVNAAAVKNAPVDDAFPMLENYRDDIKVALSQRTTVILDRIEYVNEDKKHYYKITCYPLDALEDVTVIQIDDITGREMLEQRVLQTEKMHSLDGLAAGIAHEVNNPLSAIINDIQNIKRRLEPDRPANQGVAMDLELDLEKLNRYLQRREISFFLDSIEEGAFRASNIVSNMLKFSKPSGYSREPCDINQLLEQSINFAIKDFELHEDASINSTTIELNLAKDLPRVRALPVELQQVFVNLLQNAQQAIAARKAIEPESYVGKISLETRVEGDDVVVIVGDNGIGMSDEVARKAFDPYFTTRLHSGGTGLGLSTVFRIINTLLGGQVEIRSAENYGTQFIITLHQ